MTSDSTFYFQCEKARRLFVNAVKLTAVAKRLGEWAQSRRGLLIDVAQVKIDLIACVKRLESCVRELTDDEWKGYGKFIDEELKDVSCLHDHPIRGDEIGIVYFMGDEIEALADIGGKLLGLADKHNEWSENHMASVGEAAEVKIKLELYQEILDDLIGQTAVCRQNEMAANT